MSIRPKHVAPLLLATAAVIALPLLAQQPQQQPQALEVLSTASPDYRAPDYRAPPIRVRRNRVNEDKLITQEVVDGLKNDPRLSGYIGVDTYHNEVTLEGRVTTAGMRDRAELDALRVPGVAEVHNLLRADVGDY
jgi:BON domain-containing protein